MSFASRWLDVEVGVGTEEELEGGDGGGGEVRVHCVPAALALVDLYNDNDYKLLVGDLGHTESVGPKLKTFKGATQIAELTLPDLPIALAGFYTNETRPRMSPVVAVALGCSVYIYKNMKLFYKYYLPSLELNMAEMDVWRQLTDHHSSEHNIAEIVERLKTIPYNYLSPQSQQILSLDPDRYLDFVKQTMNTPIQKSSEVTCMATLKMNSVDKYGVSCLVLGTEDGDILFLDPQTFTQLHHAKICDIKMTPYQLITSGLYEVDYRITVATREKTICVLKRDWSEGKCLVLTEEYIIAMEVMPGDHSIIVICMDKSMCCYNKKGKKQWTVQFEHNPITLTLMPITHLGTVLVAVALKSGHLQVYNGKTQVDSLFVRDVVSVMRFGQLGQEEHVLIIITLAGDLMLKILKRTADFNLHTANPDFGQGNGAPPSQQGKPWVIPKKSKLFLEQSARERENAVAIHKTFQLELNRLRLTAAKTLVDAHLKSENTVGVGSMESVRLSAEVEGLGPVFRVTLVLENSSAERAVSGLAILFHVHTSCYKVSRPYIQVPLVVPGGKLKFPTKVEEMFPDDIVSPEVLLQNITGESSEKATVRVLLLKEGRASPVLAATIQMPPTDPMMLPFDKVQSAAFE